MKVRLILGLTACLVGSYAANRAAARNLRLVNTAQVDAGDIDSLVETATRGCKTDREKMIALWAYVARNPFYHWCEAREEPEATTELGVVMDPVIALNVYGTTICYQVSHVFCNLAEAAGIERTRVRSCPGHQVPEVFYGGKWHVLDPQYDMAAYFVGDDGRSIVSLADVCRDTQRYLLEPRFPSEPFYQFDSLGGKFWPWETRQYVAERVFKPDVGESAYVFAPYIARGHTMHLDLKRGTTLIRRFANEGKWYCTPELQARWKKDPTQRWVDQGPHDPRHPENTYANGTLIYEPDWKASRCNFDDGLYAGSGYVLRDGRVHPTGGGHAEVIFRVRSPYLIVGNPGKLDVAGDSRDGAIFEGVFSRRDDAASNAVSVSTDNGLSWTEVWRNERTGTRRVRLDLTNHVEGTYGYLFKVALSGSSPEDASFGGLRLVNHLFYSPIPLPKVTPGENTFRLSLDEGHGVFCIRPDLGDADGYRRFFRELAGLRYSPSFSEHLSPAGGEGHAVIEVPAPPGCKLSWLTVHASFGVTVGKAEEESAAILYATDPAGPWQTAWQSDFSRRNDKWRWDDSVDVRLDEPAEKCYVKFLLRRRRRMSLNMVRIYAHTLRPERPLEPGEVTITHQWNEDGKPRSETVRPHPAGQTYTITAGEGPIENRAVTIAVANDG